MAIYESTADLTVKQREMLALVKETAEGITLMDQIRALDRLTRERGWERADRDAVCTHLFRHRRDTDGEDITSDRDQARDDGAAHHPLARSFAPTRTESGGRIVRGGHHHLRDRVPGDGTA